MNKNMLHEFFNSQSDTCLLEASEQERMEGEFEKWFQGRSASFEESSAPLMRYLAENHHPHTMAVVESDCATLFEGKESIKNDKYIVD